MANSQKALKPFEAGTRRRRVKLNTLPFVDGQTVNMRLPQVGLLQKITLKVFLTGTATGATAYTGDAIIASARQIINRIRLSTNTQANIVNSSAWGLNMLSYISAPYNCSSDRLASEQVSAPAGAGTWQAYFEVEIPVTLNDGINYTLGLLNLQNDDVSADLFIEWGSAAGLWNTPANMGALTGSIQPILQYMDVPDVSAYMQPPLSYIVLVREQVDSITIGTGEHRFVVPRGNVYTQLLHQLTDNYAPIIPAYPMNPTGKITDIELRMQGSTTDERVPAIVMQGEQRRRYGVDLPAGAYAIDELWDTDLPGRFEQGYQLLDSAQFTDLAVIFNIQGVTATNSKCRTITREIVRLAQ